MATVIGVVSGLLTMYSFAQTYFTGDVNNKSVVRIGVALNGGGGPSSGAEGTLTGVRLYNNNQEMIGSNGGGFIGSGETKVITINQGNSQQAAYIQVQASNDALCIAAVSIAWAANTGNYGWVGDWGRQCGLNWYYSNYYIQDSNRRPDCVWIDADRTNDFKARMIMMHMPSFSPSQPHPGNPGDFCGYPEFRAYDPNGAGIFRRGDTDGTECFNGTGEIDLTGEPAMISNVQRVSDGRLVVSDLPEHKAAELCLSPTSVGPDFVSLTEGLFCNMETSEILPLCSDEITENCFHLEDRVSKHKRDEEGFAHLYSEVLEWSS